MAAIDLTEVQKKYPGEWVAFESDEETVSGHGKTLEEAMNMAQANGCDDPIMAVMPKEVVTYFGKLV